jgi:PncC family amidohydrolase
MTEDLTSLARAVAGHLIARQQTVAVAESSAGGLISAALLSVPGASSYYLGGGVIYTGRALKGLLQVERGELEGMRSSSEPYAGFLANRVRQALRADWGLAETGAAGPTGNVYGDAAGHTCLAVVGPTSAVQTLETSSNDRAANMRVFALAALALLLQELEHPGTR